MADSNLLKVSKGKTVGFYAKAGEHFLRGVGDKPAFDSVVVSAVGNAIPSAASVADILDRRGIGKVTKIETLYTEVETGRFRPQLKITIEGLALEPETPERLKSDKMEKRMKKVTKAGGKRGVEIEGAADMGGLQYFCTNMDEPEGDTELLLECMKAMNAKSDPGEEERKGGSGHIGKLVVSCGEDEFGLVAYVPAAKQKECKAKLWLTEVCGLLGCGTIDEKSTDIYAWCCIKKDADKNIHPMKLRDGAISHAIAYLRKHKLFPEEEDDSDDDFVFGDEDFPQA